MLEANVVVVVECVAEGLELVDRSSTAIELVVVNELSIDVKSGWERARREDLREGGFDSIAKVLSM